MGWYPEGGYIWGCKSGLARKDKTSHKLSVSEETAHFLRDKVGSGDTGPYGSSVAEFFGRIGKEVIADRYGVEPDLEENEYYLTFTRPSSLDEFRERVSREAEERGVDDLVWDLWMGASHYAGYVAANENWTEALEDDLLLWRDTQEIRERYKLTDLELEFFQENVHFRS